MKHLTLIAAVALLLPGCITQDKCLKRYPPQIKEVTTYITETVTVTRDTTIYIKLPAEVQTHTDTVYIDSVTGLINSKRSRLETSLAWSTAQIINSRLHHELMQKDTTIEARLKDAIREVERLQKEITEKVTTVEVPRKLTRYQRFAVWWLGISIGLALAVGVWFAMKLKRLV